MALAFRILRDHDEAQDAVQATIVTAWRSLGELRELDRFVPWLRRILVRACYGQLRASKRSAAVREIRVDATVPDHLGGLVARDTLERGFRRLPAEQRAVLAYRYYLGLPVEAIADALGLPAGTVKSRLHYATDALRAAIDADDRAPQQSAPSP